MCGAPIPIAIGNSDAMFRPLIINTLHAVSEPRNACTLEQMRREVIKYIGNNNVLVYFHVGWALDAPQPSVNARRVVDLSVKPAFATMSYNLARLVQLPSTTGPGGIVGKVGAVANLFFKQMARHFRRWPAVLFENGFELRQNQCDNVYAKAIFTAAIWQAVQSTVIKMQQIPTVRPVKISYSVGGGNALNSTESALACARQDLLQSTDAYSDNYTISTRLAKRDDFFWSVESAHCAFRYLVYSTTHEVYVQFIKICDRLASKAEMTN